MYQITIGSYSNTYTILLEMGKGKVDSGLS